MNNRNGNRGNIGNCQDSWRNKGNCRDNWCNKGNTGNTGNRDRMGNIQADKLQAMGIQMAYLDKHHRCHFEQLQFRSKESLNIKNIKIIAIYASCTPYRISSNIF
jgi:hypothetical protein